MEIAPARTRAPNVARPEPVMGSGGIDAVVMRG
jgi:hypothetical protein